MTWGAEGKTEPRAQGALGSCPPSRSHTHSAPPPPRGWEWALKKVQLALGSDLCGAHRNKAVIVLLTPRRCIICIRLSPSPGGFSSSAAQECSVPCFPRKHTPREMQPHAAPLSKANISRCSFCRGNWNLEGWAYVDHRTHQQRIPRRAKTRHAASLRYTMIPTLHQACYVGSRTSSCRAPEWELLPRYPETATPAALSCCHSRRHPQPYRASELSLGSQRT